MSVPYQFYSDIFTIGVLGNHTFTVPAANILNAAGLQFTINNTTWNPSDPAKLELIVLYSGTQLWKRITNERIMTANMDLGVITLDGSMTVNVVNYSSTVSAAVRLSIEIFSDSTGSNTQSYISENDTSMICASTISGVRPDTSTSQSYNNPVKALTSGYLYTYAEPDMNNYDMISTIVPVDSYLKVGYSSGSPTVADGNKIIINTSSLTAFAIYPGIACYGPNKNTSWILRANAAVTTGTLQFMYGSLGVQLSPTAVTIIETVPDPLSWWLVTAASITAGDITVTLFGVDFTFALPAATGAAEIAYQFSIALNASLNSGAITCSIGPYIFFRGIWRQLTSGSSSFVTATGFTATILGNLNDNTGLSPTTYAANNQLPLFSTGPQTTTYSVQLEANPNEYIVSVNSANGDPFTPIHRINRTNNNFGFDGSIGIFGTGTAAANVFNVDLYQKISRPVMRTSSTLTYNTTTYASVGNATIAFALVKTTNWITTELTRLTVYNNNTRALAVTVAINAKTAAAGLTMAQTSTIKSGTVYSNTNNIAIPNVAVDSVINYYTVDGPLITVIDLNLKMATMATYTILLAVDPAAGGNSSRAILTLSIDEYY